jgi:hypothetical protein
MEYRELGLEQVPLCIMVLNIVIMNDCLSIQGVYMP